MSEVINMYSLKRKVNKRHSVPLKDVVCGDDKIAHYIAH